MADSFLAVACLTGVESVCKRQMAASHPELRFAYSRPGFLTFKRVDGEFPPGWEPRCAFARLSSTSVGAVEGELSARCESFWRDAPQANHLHVWARTERLRRGDAVNDDKSADSETPEDLASSENSPPTRPANTTLDSSLSPLNAALAALKPEAHQRRMAVNQTARAGERILDCIILDTDKWWMTIREASSVPSRWVGGIPPIEEPSHMVSRAYLKMQEALLWSRLPIRAGDCVAEIGSAPGGSCQALLELNVDVLGIDPAEMAPIVSSHPRFTHIRRRGAEVRRRDLAQAKWLSVDSNVAPQHTLDTLQALHEHDQVRFDGMLITLKMPHWSLADHLDDYLAQIHSWGYEVTKPRHLYHNRQELCVAALRRKSLLRSPRRKK